MKGRTRIGRWLVALLPILVALAFLSPLRVYSGGEVELEVSKEEVQVGEEVTLRALLPTPGISVRWDLGDGNTATGPLVVHAYQEAGVYTVAAKVTYPDGTERQLSVDIRVSMISGNRPPQALARVDPTQTLAGQPIAFDATGSSDPDGTISRYAWNFGDGNSSTEPQATHAYAAAGVYYVILTVTDNGEIDATDIVTVSVSALPSAVVPGIDRVVPEPAGKAPELDPLILVDMGVWDSEKEHFPYREWLPTLEPPFRGAASSNRYWLDVTPTEFERETGGAVQVPLQISVRNTLLLPRAHTSWGMVTFVVNGRVVELPVSVTVRGTDEDISDRVWPLYNEILDYLTARGQRGAMAYSTRYANAADFALGLVTEYVLEDGYQGRMARQDFITKVAEVLMDQDENGDGVVGFTDLDLNLGVKIGK